MFALLLLAACQPGDPGKDRADTASAAPTGVTVAAHPDFPTLLLVTWEQAEAGESLVRGTLADGTVVESPMEKHSAGVVSEWLFGVPYGEAVDVQVWVGTEGSASEVVPFTVAPAPEAMPRAAEVSGDPAAWDPACPWIFLSLSEDEGDLGSLDSAWWVQVLDRQGRVVWTRRTADEAVSLHPRVARDGDALLIDESTFWGGGFDQGAGSRVVRMLLDGTVLETIPTPYMHHPFTDLPGGGLAWGAVGRNTETLEVRDAAGNQHTLWDCADWLAGTDAAGNGCGSNTLFYDEGSDSYYYSFYSVHTVVQVDAASGDTLRWFGQVGGSWGFADDADNFWWQHGGNITSDGTFLVSAYESARGVENVAREFRFDDSTRRLELIWSFGQGTGVFGEYMGEAHRLPGGDTLHNTGAAPHLREVTPAGDVVWDVSWEDGGRFDRFLGRSEFFEDPYRLLPEVAALPTGGGE